MTAVSTRDPLRFGQIPSGDPHRVGYAVPWGRPPSVHEVLPTRPYVAPAYLISIVNIPWDRSGKVAAGPARNVFYPNQHRAPRGAVSESGKSRQGAGIIWEVTCAYCRHYP